MGSQLLQNTEIIKQTDDCFGKSEEYMDLSHIYLAVACIVYIPLDFSVSATVPMYTIGGNNWVDKTAVQYHRVGLAST